MAVVSALNAWAPSRREQRASDGGLECARSLAVGSGRAGQSHSAAKVRVIFAPVTGRVLIDAVMLNEAGLVDGVGMSIRTSGVVGHDMAMMHRLTVDGIEFEASSTRGFEQLHFLVAKDGAILAEGAVSGTSVLGSL